MLVGLHRQHISEVTVIRIPASNCGIYSLKPGTMRVSKIGARGTSSLVPTIVVRIWRIITECIPGFDGAPDVMGPMGRYVYSLSSVPTNYTHSNLAIVRQLC